MGGDSQKIFIIHECCLHYLQINGQFIEWRQLWDLFEKVVKMRVESLGLSLLPKLKREHVELSPFSRMRVDLAAQVCA